MSTKYFLPLVKAHAGAVARWLIVLLLAYAVSFGDSRYAKMSRVEETERRLGELEKQDSRIKAIELWQAEQKAAQALDGEQFATLQRQLATINAQLAVQIALQQEASKNMDRVLVKLDALK